MSTILDALKKAKKQRNTTSPSVNAQFLSDDVYEQQILNEKLKHYYAVRKILIYSIVSFVLVTAIVIIAMYFVVGSIYQNQKIAAEAVTASIDSSELPEKYIQISVDSQKEAATGIQGYHTAVPPAASAAAVSQQPQLSVPPQISRTVPISEPAAAMAPPPFSPSSSSSNALFIQPQATNVIPGANPPFQPSAQQQYVISNPPPPIPARGPADKNIGSAEDKDFLPLPEPIEEAKEVIESPKDKIKREFSEITLEGIIWDKNKPLALINGKIVTTGDTIKGFIITKIDKTTIELERNGEVFKLAY